MKVLMVSDFALSEEFPRGGVEAVSHSLATPLAEHETIEQLTILSFSDRVRKPHLQRLGSKLQVLRCPPQGRLEGLTFAFLDVLRTRSVARRIRADVVHGQGIHKEGFLATHSGRPAVVSMHGVVPIEARLRSTGSLLSRARVGLVDTMVAANLKCAEIVAVCSEYDQRWIASVSGRSAVLIENPVSADFCRPCLELKPPRFLFAGVVSARKNVLGIVRAFAPVARAVPEAELRLVGPTMDRAYAIRVSAAIVRLDLVGRVRLLGHVSTAELIREMASARALVMFSEEESSPMAIAQGAAMGLPVVASAVGGVHEMVQEGVTGYLIPRRDEIALTERLLALATDGALALQMGCRSWEWPVRRRAPIIIADKLVRAYEAAVATREGDRSCCGMLR